MHAGKAADAVVAGASGSAFAQQRKPRTEYRARGGGAQAHDGAWLHDGRLLRQPTAADRHMRGIRIAMQAALAALLETEMLHRVGEIQPLPRNAGLRQRLVQQLAGGTRSSSR